MSPLAQSLIPAIDAGAILARCTLWPWIVDVCWSRVEGVGMRTIDVLAAPMHQPPDPHDHVPAGAMLLRADVFPATRFEDMTAHVRGIYSAHYRAFLLWRRARSLNKTLDELQRSTDFDSDSLEQNVARWVRSGGWQ